MGYVLLMSLVNIIFFRNLNHTKLARDVRRVKADKKEQNLQELHKFDELILVY